MRHRPERGLQADQGDLAFAEAGLGGEFAALQVFLPPSPAAKEGFLLGEPSDAVGFHQRGIRVDAEDRVVVEEDVAFFRHAVGERIFVVEARGQNGAGHEELRLGQMLRFPVCVGLGEEIGDRHAHRFADRRRRADADDRATGRDKRFQRRDGLPADGAAQRTHLLRHLFVRRIVVEHAGADDRRARGRIEELDHGFLREPTRAAGHEIGVAREDQHVEFLVETAGFKQLRVDDLVGKLVFVEHQAQPTGLHHAAIQIEQADADGFQLHRRARRSLGLGICADPELTGRRFDDGRGGGAGGNPQRARAEPDPVDDVFILQPIDVAAGFEQTIRQHKGVVDLVAHEITGGGARADDRGDRRGFLVARYGDERAVETVENAVKLHAHLHGQGPAGDVVGHLRRTARVGEVVGVILRLKHVHHEGTERLRGLHDVGPGRIRLARDLERRGGAFDRDAVAHEGVDKFHRRREISLIGRQNEAARIAVGRIVEHAFVEFGRRGFGEESRQLILAGFRRFDAGGFVERFDAFRGDRPGVAVAAINGVFAHAIDVGEKQFAVARSIVERRPVELHFVVDRLAVVPELGLDRQRPIALGQLF